MSRIKFLFFFITLFLITSPQLFGEEYAKCKLLKKISSKEIHRNQLDRIETFKAKILTGKFKNKIIDVKNYIWGKSRKYYKIDAKVGDTVIGKFDKIGPNKISGYVAFYHRSNMILPVFLLFTFVVIFFIGKKGIRAITALIIVYILLILFIYLLKTGVQPFYLGLLFAFFSSFITFLLVLKGKEKIIASTSGTIIGIGIVSLTAFIIIKVAHITGMNTSLGRMIMFFNSKLPNFHITDLTGIIISGSIISAIGAIMDIATGTSSALFAIKKENPNMNLFELFSRGLSVGKDIIGTMVNTLIFAAVGSMIFLFLIFYIMKTPFYRFSNFEFFVMGMIPAMAGSIGMLLAVPSTLVTGIIYIYFQRKGISLKKLKLLSVVFIGIIIFGISTMLFAWISPPDYDLEWHPITQIYQLRNKQEYPLVKVLNVKPYIKPDSKYKINSQKVKVKILSGTFKNKEIEFDNYLWGDSKIDFLFKKGNKAVAWLEKENGKIKMLSFADRYRFFILYYFGALFLLLLLIQSKMLGLKIFLSILFSIFLIIFFFVPFVAKGFSIMPLTFAISLIIILLVNFAIGKNRTMIISSTIGCFLGAVAGYIFALIAGTLLKINGFSIESIQELNYFNAYYNNGLIKYIPHLVYAMIIFSATGALTDMGITISSSINEIYSVNPSIPFKRLYKYGIEIGGDVAGTMINTLILAYVGTNMGMILLFSIGSTGFLHLFNLEFISVEIVKGLAGTIGMLSIIPITSFISSKILKSKKIEYVN